LSTIIFYNKGLSSDAVTPESTISGVLCARLPAAIAV